MRTRLAPSLIIAVSLVACPGGEELPAEAPLWPDSIPHEEQRPGDPEAGYDTFINAPYISCGIPRSVYSMVFGPPTADEQIPGRTGGNEDLPFWLTSVRTDEGADLVTSNCMICHAGRIDGELIVGLGTTTEDFTRDTTSGVAAMVQQLAQTPAEQAEAARWARSVEASAPYLVTKVLGTNPAENLAAILMSHRDPQTLAWSDELLFDPPPLEPVPVDVPPLWRVAKKSALFYTGGTRGDLARSMTMGSLLCTSDLEELEWIDSLFVDVRAWMASIEPPEWPWNVDAEPAAVGRDVFERTCSDCHGTYGPDGHYPNRLIPVEDVGTDPELVIGGGQFAGRYVDWFNSSYFGEAARAEPASGYMPPPLDGIWATAPFLHNGSVPTLRALLDSAQRPTYWTRSFNSTDYDRGDVGWEFEELDHGQADEPAESVRARLYDTTLLGYDNRGHTYGDSLDDADRDALIEYLKTL